MAAKRYHVVRPAEREARAGCLATGQIYAQLSDHEEAGMMFEYVVNDDPDSAEARPARRALETRAAKDKVLRE